MNGLDAWLIELHTAAAAPECYGSEYRRNARMQLSQSIQGLDVATVSVCVATSAEAYLESAAGH